MAIQEKKNEVEERLSEISSRLVYADIENIGDYIEEFYVCNGADDLESKYDQFIQSLNDLLDAIHHEKMD